MPREQREFGALTLSVTEKQHAELQRELRSLRERLLQLADNPKADRVVQINLQLFPVSRPKPKRNKR